MNELLASGEAKEMIDIIAFWVKYRIYGAIIGNILALAVIIYLGVRYRGTVKHMVKEWYRRLFR